MQLAEIRKKLSTLKGNGASFEDAIAQLSQKIEVPNADNWQMVFDLLYWDWNEPIDPNELDRISLKFSPFGEHQEAIIQSQIDSANEWRKALEAADIDPRQALSLAHTEARFIVEKEQAQTVIAKSPSPLSIPQHLVVLYRQFYRPVKRWGYSNTDALKPLQRAKEVIVKAHPKATNEELVFGIAGDLERLMKQIKAGTAQGRWVISSEEDERQAICEFAQFIVYQVLVERFQSDRSQFSSKGGYGLIEDACQFLFRLEQDKENQKKAS